MFITMEGTDGSGKTTQIGLLHRRLLELGHPVLLTREPGGTPIAEAIRAVALSREYEGMEPLTEALLFAAARAQHVREAIRPALREGKIVLCDRYFDSSLAYQGFGRQLGADVVTRINRDAMDGLLPDRTYLLAVDEQTARSRHSHREDDRIEGAGEGFYRRVLEGFQHAAKDARVCVIDASPSPDDVAEQIWKDLAPRLSLR